MRRNLPLGQMRRAIPAFTAALIAAGVLTEVQAQVQSAGTLFVNVDATGLPEGPVNSIPNTGTLGGVFAATGATPAPPVVATIGGTKAMRFGGTNFLQLVTAAQGGTPVAVPDGLVSADPTRSIEVWALNPALDGEETLVSWGKRGGPDGSNMSFNFGSDFRWGGVGHWGNRDIGWNNQGGGPAVNRWHHLVYTFDGTTTRLYVDGAFANGEYLGAGAIDTHPDSSILIGSQMEADGITPTPNLRFTGSIARVRVHDGVLTAEQVATNFNAEKAAFIDPAPTQQPTVEPARLTKAPIHRYSFGEAAGDATDKQVRDSVGTAHGVVLGEGATFTGSRLVLPGGASATAAYADLPNGLLSTNAVANGGTGAFSIETWAKITGSQNWSRFWDFGSSGTIDGTEEVLGPGGGGEGRDYFMYSTSNGTDVNNRRLELRNEDPAGGGIATVDNGTRTFNTDVHVLVTWDEATGRLVAYENGVQVSTMTTDDKMSDINDVNVWLGRSNWTGDANTQGEFDEVRLYDYVLTPGQALGNATAGPDLLNDRDVAVTIASQPQNVTVSETGNATFRVAAPGSSPITYQWLRNGTPIPGATSAVYTLNNVSAADSGATFSVRVSNTVNGAPVTVTSSPATLTVVSTSVALKHRYSFNEASGTTVADSVGNANGTVVGNATFGGGQLTLDGLESYVNLPNGIVSGLGADGTIEMWITHENTSIWTRIFDFGVSDAGEDQSGGGVDFLCLTPRTDNGYPRFIANFPGGGDLVTLDPAPPGWIPGNDETHIVISWASSGNVSRLFIDGMQVATGTAPRPLSNLAGQDVNNWLGRSQFIADAYWGGKYNEFRLYSGAMPPSQVQSSFSAGPASLPTTPSERPNLTAQVSGNNLTISWPTAASGFVLESSPTLGTGATWTAVTGATQSGDRTQVSVQTTGGTRFFRLRQQ